MKKSCHRIVAKNIDVLKKTDKLYFYAQMFAYVKKKLYLCIT